MASPFSCGRSATRCERDLEGALRKLGAHGLRRRRDDRVARPRACAGARRGSTSAGSSPRAGTRRSKRSRPTSTQLAERAAHARHRPCRRSPGSTLSCLPIPIRWSSASPPRRAGRRTRGCASASTTTGARLRRSPTDGRSSTACASFPPTLLWLELDLGWVWHAGGDPIAELEATHGRCPLVHVKDYASREDRDDVPVGDGHRRLRARASPPQLEAGAEWLIVEEDEVGPDPFGAVQRSLEAVRRIGRMTEPMRVGVVGCGIIAKHYVEQTPGVRAGDPSPAPTSTRRPPTRSAPSTTCACCRSTS